MTDYSTSVDEKGILLQNRELIVLKEALDYCANGQDKVRYTTLKKLSNESLSKLTEGKEVDFGGNFETIIKGFEKERRDKRFLERVKQSSKKTFIIPNIDRIKDLLEKRGLLDSSKEDISSYLPFEKRVGDTPKGLYGFYRISHTSEKAQVYRNWIEFAKKKQVYSSNFWDISMWQEDERFTLLDTDIQKILRLGNKISLQNDSRPFRIILEYRGLPISMTDTVDDLETFTEAAN
jgi:hypothetical protein